MFTSFTFPYLFVNYTIRLYGRFVWLDLLPIVAESSVYYSMKKTTFFSFFPSFFFFFFKEIRFIEIILQLIYAFFR